MKVEKRDGRWCVIVGGMVYREYRHEPSAYRALKCLKQGKDIRPTSGRPPEEPIYVPDLTDHSEEKE